MCAGLLPTGKVLDVVTVEPSAVLGGFAPFTLPVTCIDNGMPLVLLRAADVGRSGYESVAELNADSDLKIRIEALRLKTGQLMGLGDVSAKNYPKMTLIAAPLNGGSLSTAASFRMCATTPSVCWRP